MQAIKKAYVYAHVLRETEDARLRDVYRHSIGPPSLARCVAWFNNMSRLPAVNGSGFEMNEANASPGVTKGS